MEPLLGPLSIIERAPGVYTIVGELDDTTAHRLDRLANVNGPLVLDLHEVSFMNSAGIAALVRLHQTCQDDGCTFRIEACSPPVERVLRIVGLHEVFLDGSHAGAEGDGGVDPPWSGAGDELEGRDRSASEGSTA
jgi:anti-anti-sigma factor